MTPETLTSLLLGNGPLLRTDAPFRLLEVRGVDAAEFLHRLCSQDVRGLADGAVAPAAFLDAKGKLQVTCLIFRLGASLWLEVQAEQVERLAALLDRYHFTEKLTIARGTPAPCWELVESHPDQASPLGIASGDGSAVTVAIARRGLRFQRSHGRAFAGTGVAAPRPLTSELAECLRMLAGFVRVGVETEPTTLALEADLDDHCSSTKGCYTGQEIVARIHTYGHVNRKLCLLRLDPGAVITTPQALADDGVPVGRVMHAVPVPGHAMRLGVGYLPEDFQRPGTQLAVVGDGSATVLR